MRRIYQCGRVAFDGFCRLDPKEASRCKAETRRQPRNSRKCHQYPTASVASELEGNSNTHKYAIYDFYYEKLIAHDRTTVNFATRDRPPDECDSGKTQSNSPNEAQTNWRCFKSTKRTVELLKKPSLSAIEKSRLPPISGPYAMDVQRKNGPCDVVSVFARLEIASRCQLAFRKTAVLL